MVFQAPHPKHPKHRFEAKAKVCKLFPEKDPRKRVEQVHIRKLWFYYDIYSVSSPLSSVSSPV